MTEPAAQSLDRAYMLHVMIWRSQFILFFLEALSIQSGFNYAIISKNEFLF